MAVSQMLYDEPMPLILDDSFVLYDDERLKNTHQMADRTEGFQPDPDIYMPSQRG